MFEKSLRPNKDIGEFYRIIKSIESKGIRYAEDELINHNFGSKEEGNERKYVVRNGKDKGIVIFRGNTCEMIYRIGFVNGELIKGIKHIKYENNTKTHDKTIKKMPDGMPSEIGYIIKLEEDKQKKIK